MLKCFKSNKKSCLAFELAFDWRCIVMVSNGFINRGHHRASLVFSMDLTMVAVVVR